MSTPITVVIPVGPRAEDCAYFDECFDSVMAQTSASHTILVVDDMHTGGGHDCAVVRCGHGSYYRTPWVMGVAHAFNIGVSMAPTEHVLLLGADDRLEPDAIACAQRTIAEHQVESAYYFFGVRYSDGRPDQTVPCGAAVVTKKLWEYSGGFPIEAAVGRSDVMLIGLLSGHPEVGSIIPIEDNGTPPYWYRSHEASHTASRGPWIAALETTADAYWRTWEAPRWGRTI